IDLFGHFHSAGGRYFGGDDKMDAYINQAQREFDAKKRQAIVHDIQRYEGGKLFQPKLGGASSFRISWPVVRNKNVWSSSNVLLAISTDPQAAKMLKALSVDIPDLQRDIEVFFGESVDRVPERRNLEVRQTPTFRRVLDRATEQMRAAGRDQVDVGALLVSFY